MRELRKPTVSSFVEYLVNKYFDEKQKYSDKFDFEGVNVVAKYEVITPILNELIKESPFMLASAELSDCMWDGYTDEFVLTINNDGEIYVEKVYVEEKDIYLYIGDGLTFLHNDCNSKFLKTNEGADIVAFEISENEDRCGNCSQLKESSDTEVHCWDDDDMHGFTKFVSNENGFYSISFYSTDKDLVDKASKVVTE